MAKRKITKKSKRRLMLFGIPCFIFIIYFCITFISYAYNYSALKAEEKKLNNELVFLRDKKKSLKNEIVKLNDTDYIIRYAKQTYLYSTNGEYVIKLSEDKEPKIEKEESPYIIYAILISIAVVLCFIFLKKEKNNTK